jgi:diguanylate cyclase (GGDEF)-like protein
MARGRHPGRSANAIWRTRWADVWPFIAVALVGVVILPFGWDTAAPWTVGLFVVLTLVTLVMIALGIRRRRRSWLAIVAPFMVFVDLGIARYAAGPAVASGIGPLVLLPVLWIALKGSRIEMVVAGLFSAAFFWVPAAVIGPPSYPTADWYRGLLTAAIALLVAPVIQRVVRMLAAAHAQERQASRQAEAVTTRWRALLEQLPDTVVAAVADRDGGLDGVETLGGSEELRSRFARIILDGHQDTMRDLFDRSTRERAEVELADEATGRTLAAVAVPLSGAEPAETLLMIRDVTRDRERERALDRSRRQLAYLADHDPVSGLLNRRRFDQLLEEHVAKSDSGSLLLLDLDLFKQVNDTLGHAAGDRLIVTVARILQDEVRASDAVARLGGDEFAVLLPDAGADAARKVAGRLVERVKSTVATLGDRHPPVTASVGVVTICAARWHGVDLMTLADVMLYEAKAAGRDRYAVFDENEAELPVTSRAAVWQGRVNRALEDHTLVLLMQPVMNLRTGAVNSAEALVRLQEDGRLIPPAEFIEAAEGTELITRLDCEVIRQGISMLSGLRRRHPHFQLAINVSGRSFGEPVLEQTILQALAEHGVPGSALILEVTETAAVADVERARGFAERMNRLGCTLSLDDFGAGFGTFTRLKRLTFEYVKIYGEFVAAAVESEVDRSLMRSIIRVAHDLGKQVVAEHVADQQTLDLVRQEGADFVQGFHIGKPMPAEDFVESFLSDHGSGSTSSGTHRVPTQAGE